MSTKLTASHHSNYTYFISIQPNNGSITLLLWTSSNFTLYRTAPLITVHAISTSHEQCFIAVKYYRITIVLLPCKKTHKLDF